MAALAESAADILSRIRARGYAVTADAFQPGISESK